MPPNRPHLLIPLLFLLQHPAAASRRSDLDRFAYRDDATSDFHRYIAAKVAAIRQECGEVCVTREERLRERHPDPGNSVKGIRFLKKDVECRMLFQEDSVHDRLDVRNEDQIMIKLKIVRMSRHYENAAKVGSWLTHPWGHHI